MIFRHWMSAYIRVFKILGGGREFVEGNWATCEQILVNSCQILYGTYSHTCVFTESAGNQARESELFSPVFHLDPSISPLYGKIQHLNLWEVQAKN